MSNVLKWTNANIDGDEKRVLDMSEIAARRIEKAQSAHVIVRGGEIMPDASDDGMGGLFEDGVSEGFVSGLAATMIDSEQYQEGEAPEGVIKAQDEFAQQMQADFRAQSDALLEQANAQAQDIIASAQEQAENILAQANEAANAQAESIFAQASEDGYAQGSARAMEEIHEMELQFQQKEQELEAFYQQQLDVLEPQFIDAITEIYEQIFCVELAEYKPILMHLIRSTMCRIENAKNFLIHVSEADYDFVKENKEMLEAVSPGNVVELTRDISLSENACMIETDGGIFDCSVGLELKELTQKLKLLSYTSGR